MKESQSDPEDDDDNVEFGIRVVADGREFPRNLPPRKKEANCQSSPFDSFRIERRFIHTWMMRGFHSSKCRENDTFEKLHTRTEESIHRF